MQCLRSDIQHWYIPCFLQAGSFEGQLPSASQPSRCTKTAITTPFGTYVFHYSTFGLRNSGATFQRMMDQIFGHLPYCRVYIDDILVASETHREHREHPHSVLELFHKNGLVIRREMRIWSINCRVPWSRHQWRWHPTPSIQGRRSQQISKTNYSQITTRIPGDDKLLSQIYS